VVTDSRGFTETEILDETARIGDWHEYELQFDPVNSSAQTDSPGRIQLTLDELERVAEPVEPVA
jgi:hypothetical protein